MERAALLLETTSVKPCFWLLLGWRGKRALREGHGRADDSGLRVACPRQHEAERQCALRAGARAAGGVRWAPRSPLCSMVTRGHHGALPDEEGRASRLWEAEATQLPVSCLPVTQQHPGWGSPGGPSPVWSRPSAQSRQDPPPRLRENKPVPRRLSALG